MASVYPLVLFGGGQVSTELRRGAFVISLDDGWIQFAAASHQVGNTRLLYYLHDPGDEILRAFLLLANHVKTERPTSHPRKTLC